MQRERAREEGSLKMGGRETVLYMQKERGA